jgi:hypothetical protein
MVYSCVGTRLCRVLLRRCGEPVASEDFVHCSAKGLGVPGIACHHLANEYVCVGLGLC